MYPAAQPAVTWFKNNLRGRIPRWIYELTIGLLRNSHRTYSQFGQDAVLLAYFRRREWAIGRKTGPGRYLEIGAFLPITHSNTYALYRRGWRGVTVEALPNSRRAFDILRGRDRHLEVAVGTTAGTITFYHWGGVNGFNTTSAEQAQAAERTLGTKPQQITVRAQTLSQIIDDNKDYLLDIDLDIDLLALSIAGMEAAVLSSNDWQRHRPKMIIVELLEAEYDRIRCSFTYQLLQSQNYRLYAWTPTMLIFLRGDQFPFNETAAVS